MRTLRTALDEQQALFARASSVRDPQEFFALQNQHLQDLAQRTQAYWINVYEIAAGVCGGYLEAAQDQLGKSQCNVQAFVESLASNAPVGSEAVVSAWKSAIDAATEPANSAYEAARKAAQRRERREPSGRARGSAENGKREEVIPRGGFAKEGGFVRLFSFSGSAAQLLQREFVGPADPHRRVAMIAQRASPVFGCMKISSAP
ncbi:MAG: hypothetical protein CBHOC_2492 [uncultured Caballeronia sp.]|nr:MAG: hypothetical protein CBHOC_2492 [uncultured Caballeronia sp.]